MALHHVLMGDITGSAERDGRATARHLRETIRAVASRAQGRILSPLTVTLGDEFQGIVDSHKTAVALILDFLMMRLIGEMPFPMRFSLVTGEIETAINPKIAHEMLGPALTSARAHLSDKRRDRPDISVSLPDRDLAVAMERTFDILYRRTEDWVGEEGAYLADLVNPAREVDEIAARHDRTKPTIYRRRRTDAVRDFIAARDALRHLALVGDRMEPTWS